MPADTAPAWPDPARPGVPLNPDADSLHWVQCPQHGEVYAWWDTEGWRIFSTFYSPLSAVKRGIRYLGPCLTPSEVAKLRARVVDAWRHALADGERGAA